MNHKTWLTVLGAVCLMGFVSCTTAPRNFVTGQGEVISATTGTPQSHAIDGTFAMPLAVTVNQNGLPASGVAVKFTAPAVGASGKFADTGTASTTAMTDVNGLATAAAFIANGTVGTYTITASAQGAQTAVPFSLTNTTGAPAVLLPTGGTPQSAGINSTYATPLTVQVVDVGQNPVQYAVVTFNAPTSAPTAGAGASGTFADTGTYTTSATTDANGVATSTAFTANSISGADNISASVAGVTAPAVFNLTNLAGVGVTITATSGTPQKAAIDTAFSTQLAATVQDSFLNPVSGVTVTFNAPASGASATFSNGTASETDVTDANGRATSTVFSANGTAGGPYTVTAAAGGVAALADFSLTNTLPFKNYVFSISGEEISTASFYALAGAVQIDSAGNVLGGEQDYNDGGFGIASPEPTGDTITGGTLKVNASTGQGTLVLSTDNPSLGVAGKETFGVQFVNVNHALINQFDGTATSSGSMDVQTVGATLSGGYAFTLTGVDPYLLPVAFGGVFTISGGTNLQNGLLDTNDEGTTTTGTSLTGTLSPPDSFGRGTITSTLNYKGLIGTPAPVLLNYYVVGPEVFRIIDIDSPFSGTVTSDSALGSAFGQGVNASSSGNTSLGSSVFGIIGNTLSQFATAGMFTTSTAGATFSGIADDAEFTNGVLLSASPISGNYSIGTNGYGSLTITSGSLGDVSFLGLYMTDPNLNLNDPNNTSSGLGGALVADMDAVLPAGTGVLIPQTDTATASFTGNYAFSGQAYASLQGFGEFDFVGRGKVTSGVFSGSALVSDPFLNLGTKATDSGVKFAGTPLADPSNPGYYTMLSTNPTPNPLAITVSGSTTDFDVVIYQASGGQLFWLNEDFTSAFLGLLQQQTSLTGIPAIRIGPVAPRMAPAGHGGSRR